MSSYTIETLICKKDLDAKIQQLGKEISTFYRGKGDLVLIGLLRGSFIFLADLSREIDLVHHIDFMTASSYGNTTETSGDVRILKDLDDDIAGKNVLIVEDIIDTGNTLSKVRDILKLRKPKSVEICTLLDKPERREVEVDVRWFGFKIPDEFVIGMGIDYAQNHRNLPYIGKVVFTEPDGNDAQPE